MEWASYLDAIGDLLDKYEAGEIDADEFSRLHELASDALDQDEPPSADVSSN